MKEQSKEFDRVYNAIRTAGDGMFPVSNESEFAGKDISANVKFDLRWLNGRIDPEIGYRAIVIPTRIGDITIVELMGEEKMDYVFQYGRCFCNCFSFLPKADMTCIAATVDNFFRYDCIFTQLIGLLESIYASLPKIETSTIVNDKDKNAYYLLDQPLELFEFDQVYADYLNCDYNPVEPYAAMFFDRRRVVVRTLFGEFHIQEFRSKVGSTAMRDPVFTVKAPETFPFDFPEHLREHGLHQIFDKNRWDSMSVSMVIFFAQLMLAREGKWLVPNHQLKVLKSNREIVLEMFANMFFKYTDAPIWSPVQVYADPVGRQSIVIKLPDGPEYITLMVKDAEVPFVRADIPERLQNQFAFIDSTHPYAATSTMMRRIFGKELLSL